MACVCVNCRWWLTVAYVCKCWDVRPWLVCCVGVLIKSPVLGHRIYFNFTCPVRDWNYVYDVLQTTGSRVYIGAGKTFPVHFADFVNAFWLCSYAGLIFLGIPRGLYAHLGSLLSRCKRFVIILSGEKILARRRHTRSACILKLCTTEKVSGRKKIV
jgi:hypothetical protein